MFWKKEKSPKFIATSEVGRLSRWLRVLGYDCVYFQKPQKRELILTSLREGRVIVTRTSGLSRFSGTRMIRLKDDLVEHQVKQVIGEMRLEPDKDKIFTRCVLCNSPIERVKKEDVKGRVPPYVYKTQEDFLKCPECGKIYWKGTHFKLAKDFLKGRAKI